MGGGDVFEPGCFEIVSEGDFVNGIAKGVEEGDGGRSESACS
ncbi:MAG: hypothetical protein M2R45_05375 [Verrucomicrobia subdivision 3 bacterium]|nr:hypothetical protein [Limisphaerales bacterium]